MAIREIFCQEKAIGVLEQGYNCGRGAHAYIFAGVDGVGKFKTAKEWGKLLLCKEPVKQKKFWDSCGKCPSCIAIEAGTHPDFAIVYKELREWTSEGKDKLPPTEMPIDVIREFLVEKVSIRPTLSNRKVFVISEGEKLNRESQSSLLKVLEEPPAYCTIILLCTQPENLFATIRSRCQIVRFGLITEEKIIERLEEDGLDKKKAQYFARLSGGSLGRACSWAELEKDDAKLHQTAISLVKELADSEYTDALVLADKFLKASRETGKLWSKLSPKISTSDITRKARKTYIEIIISALSDCLALKTGAGKKIINFEIEKELKKMSERWTAEELCSRISAAFWTLQTVDWSVNEKLIYHQLLLKILNSAKMEVLQY